MEDQDRNSFEPYDAHHRCQALSKQRRKQCGRAASVGRQHCKFHGGASLVGPDHARYTGKSRYLSKYLPRRLEQRLVEAQQQPDLATLRKELGLLDLRLNDLLQRLGPDTPETVREAIWPEVYGLVHLKAKTVDVYARKAKIYEQFFTLSEVSAVVQGLVAVIERLPLEPEERARAFHQCRAVFDFQAKTYHADQGPGPVT